MNEEEANQPNQENKALKEAIAQKEQLIEELEGMLMGTCYASKNWKGGWPKTVVTVANRLPVMAWRARENGVPRVESRPGDYSATRAMPFNKSRSPMR